MSTNALGDSDQQIKKFFHSGSENSTTLSQTRQEVITTAIGKYLISSMRPISEIENEGFVELLQAVEPAYRPPCRKTLRSRVVKQCEAASAVVRNEVSSVKYCAGQADLWSSRRMHGYFGMCISYIANNKLYTRMVACRRFTGQHSGENIATMYNTLVQEFGVTANMIAMVTDNAANMKKAFPVFTASTDEVSEDEEDSEFERVDINWDDVQDEVPVPLPKRYSCNAHTLQLVVNDGLKEGTDKIKQLISRCKSLVSSIHKSCKATELLESEAGRQIPAANATRWNSTLTMIESMIKIETEHSGILIRVAEVVGSTVRLTAKDLATLKELQVLLQPIASATVKLEAENVPTSNLVLPLVIGISKAFARVNTVYCTSVKTGLMNAMVTRFGNVATDSHYVISTFLDPRFKLKWTSSQEEECLARSLLMKQIELTTDFNEEADQSGTLSTSDDDLLGFMACGNNDRIQSCSSELDGYIGTINSAEPLAFWAEDDNKRRFSRLYQLHLQHHIIPATSSAMERVFSSAGYIVSARRSRLADDMIEKMLLARCNRDCLL